MPDPVTSTGENLADAPVLPRAWRLLLIQIRYQARLLAGGRSVVIGVGLPMLLLIASTDHGHAPLATVAGKACFGLTLTAWSTYGVKTVATRESGILQRWRASPLPRSCYLTARLLAIPAWPRSPRPPPCAPRACSTTPT